MENSSKKWWRFDDSEVTPLEENKIGIEKEPKKVKKRNTQITEHEGYVREQLDFLIYLLPNLNYFFLNAKG